MHWKGDEVLEWTQSKTRGLTGGGSCATHQLEHFGRIWLVAWLLCNQLMVSGWLQGSFIVHSTATVTKWLQNGGQCRRHLVGFRSHLNLRHVRSGSGHWMGSPKSGEVDMIKSV